MASNNQSSGVEGDKSSSSLRFDKNRTDAFCSKMWILPDRTIVPLTQMHFRWILANQADLLKDYKVSFTHIEQEEQPIRLHALKHGFTRVNYTRQHGKLTVECHNNYWNPWVWPSIRQLVVVNLDLIDNLRFNVVADDASTVATGFRQIFQFDDQGKIEQVDSLFQELTWPFYKLISDYLM